MLDASQIAALHDAANAAWHLPEGAPEQPGTAFLASVLAQHRANFELWHQEDLARDPGASDATIAGVKHAIDSLNQRRNDLMEQLDHHALAAAPPDQQDGPLHSETPGMMIDRLSILSLKIFHTAEETARPEAGEAHRARNRERLETLRVQRADLADALDALWSDIAAKRRRFKIYRQMKMYNDPSLNPVLYGRRTSDWKG